MLTADPDIDLMFLIQKLRELRDDSRGNSCSPKPPTDTNAKKDPWISAMESELQTCIFVRDAPWLHCHLPASAPHCFGGLPEAVASCELAPCKEAP